MPDTTIVVPCYNEARRLPVAEFERFGVDSPPVRFCFVNDGSSDDTAALLRAMVRRSPGRFDLLDLEANCGKAEAVRAGVRHVLAGLPAARLVAQAGAPPRFVGFWDADLSTPLHEIPRFLEVAERRPEARFLCGSRIRRMGASVERRASRHYLGRIFATAASFLLRLPVYDTQCGAKLIEAELARRVFAETFTSRWLFDVELFARIVAALGRDPACRAIVEIPLTEWHDKPGSKLSARHYARVPWELLRIYRRYRKALSA